MKILVIAEHNNTTIRNNTYNTITAAAALQGEVTVLVAGYQIKSVAEAVSKVHGVQRVLMADHTCYQHFLAENMADLIATVGKDYQAILAPASTFGKNILPRVAAMLDVGQLSDVTQIIDQQTVVRPIYAGNAFATVVSHDAIKVMTVRSTAFTAASLQDLTAPIEVCDLVFQQQHVQFVSHQLSQATRPELTAARIIVSGGRGMQAKENFAMLEQLADCLGAALGASRAAVDAGFVANDYQVGQTGKIVAPALYIAIGISGAIQHLAGMKDSKVIVAINKDEDAPIFQIADYGLVADLFKAIPEMITLLQQTRTA